MKKTRKKQKLMKSQNSLMKRLKKCKRRSID